MSEGTQNDKVVALVQRLTAELERASLSLTCAKFDEAGNVLQIECYPAGPKPGPSRGQDESTVELSDRQRREVFERYARATGGIRPGEVR